MMIVFIRVMACVGGVYELGVYELEIGLRQVCACAT